MCTRGRPTSSFPVEVRGFFARSNNASLPFTVTKHASEQTQLHCYEGVEATSNRKTQARTRSQSTLRSRRDAEEKEMNRKKKKRSQVAWQNSTHTKPDAHRAATSIPFFHLSFSRFHPFNSKELKGWLFILSSFWCFCCLFSLILLSLFSSYYYIVCVCVCACASRRRRHTRL